MLLGYSKLLAAALLVTLTAVLTYLSEKKTAFGRWKPWERQGVIGVLFGALAVLGTEFGVPIGGAILNVRDAAPLCAGLIFGAPAGLIAGVIGGAERWFAVYWGAGAYTRLACSVSTVLAGVLAAALRRHLFDNKKPSWFYALCIGIVMEVLHMLMIFLSNLSDVRVAFSFVSQCALPMILFNALAVTLSVFLVSRIAGEAPSSKERRKRIDQAFQGWLLVCVIAAFLVTCLFTLTLQTRLAYRDAEQLLALNLQDARQDIQDVSDENLLRLTRTVAKWLNSQNGERMEALLPALAAQYGVSEIDVIDTNGVITACTNPEFVGYNMAAGEQSRAFLKLLGETEELVQAYQPISYDASLWRKYAGVKLNRGGFVQVGYDAENFQRDLAATVVGIARNRHVGEGGGVFISDQNGVIVSDKTGYEGRPLAETGLILNKETTPENAVFSSQVMGQSALCVYTVVEGFTIAAFLPKAEAMFSRDVSVYVIAFMEIILFAALFTMIYFLLKRLVVDNIHGINRSLAQITGGNLNVQVDVRSSQEFASLSDDINETVTALKRYIAEAAARIDQELEYARAIQHAALPSVFPPFPDRTDFDIYALMDTAKEVGGDFFDFYLLNPDTLVVLIADVSGKGIPAALFMMTAKTLLKSCAETGMPVEQVLTRANEKLCQGNDANMFVTAWMGVIDLKTGLVRYANAGHNPPLVHRRGSGWEYLKVKPGFVLAGMEGMRYRVWELQLEPGDALFLYTDGVTEATDAHQQLYGDQRLLAVANGAQARDMKALCEAVKADVDGFAGDAPQFDDITMLAFRLSPLKETHELTVPAREESLPQALAFVDEQLQALNCPAKTQAQIDVAVDELFSNIARYAYAPNDGPATLRIEGTAHPPAVTLTFIDAGIPYNPLQNADPDVTLSADERKIGGLGIYIVKKSMDEMGYAYQDGKNVLWVRKSLV